MSEHQGSQEQQALDREAIGCLRQGNINGLEPLVRGYQVQAARVAYQITLDRWLAEEIVQEAFLKFHQHIERFDPKRLFWPYFRQIVTRDALKVIGRRKREISIDYIEGEDEAFSVGTAGAPQGISLLSQAYSPRGSDRLEAAETRQAVKEALKKLSPRQRTIIVLYYFEELSEPEIAAELGIALGTVKRNKYDGRKRLVKLLDGYWNVPPGGRDRWRAAGDRPAV